MSNTVQNIIESPRAYGLWQATKYVSTPATVVSGIALFTPSSEQRTHPIRELNIEGHHIFEHTGNMVNGAFIGTATIVLGSLLAHKYVQEKDDKKATALIASTASIASAGISIAYEAGATIPPFPAKPAEAQFDAGDALYGSLTGIALATTFAISSLRKSRQQRRVKNSNPSTQ